jgi:hypothetical protein
MTSDIESPDLTPICGGVGIASPGVYELPRNPIPEGCAGGKIELRLSEPCCGFDIPLLRVDIIHY